MKWLEDLIEKFKRPPSQAERNVEELSKGLIRLGNVLKEAEEQSLKSEDYSLSKKETDFEIAKKKFNKDTDLLVISYAAASLLSKEDGDWLESMGNKVIYFSADSLVNVAIVRAGYGLNW